MVKKLLLTAAIAASTILGMSAKVEYVFNTDFTNGELNGFGGWGNQTGPKVEDNVLVLTNEAEKNSWEVQFAYDFKEPLTPDIQYTLKMKAKASVATSSNFNAGFQFPNGDAGYPSCGEFGQINLTTEWKEIKLTAKCEVKDDWEATRLVFSYGKFVGQIFISEISLSYGEEEGGDEGDDNKGEVVYLFDTDFEDGQNIFNGWGGEATREVVDGALVIDNPKAEAEFYSVQVAYDFPEPLTEGTEYTLKLKVKGSVESASDFSAGFQVKSTYAGAGDFGAIPLTTEYKELTLKTTCTNEEGDRFLFSLGKYVGKIYIDEVSLSYVKPNAINEIEVVDNSNAPVEYYNLQGVKVNIDNAANGIYVRRQGTEVKKVLIRK